MCEKQSLLGDEYKNELVIQVQVYTVIGGSNYISTFVGKFPLFGNAKIFFQAIIGFYSESETIFGMLFVSFYLLFLWCTFIRVK